MFCNFFSKVVVSLKSKNLAISFFEITESCMIASVHKIVVCILPSKSTLGIKARWLREIAGTNTK